MADKKQFRTSDHKIVGDTSTEFSDLLNLYDLDNPDIALFNLIDDELIRLGGSKILLYKFFRRQGLVDDVYGEASQKSISNTPIVLQGHYEPQALEENLTEFGIEVQSEQLFTFNKSYIEKVVGRPLIAGDILQPDFQNLKYEVFEVQEDQFDVYGVYHLTCAARVLRDDEDITRTDETFPQDKVY
tara:strand:- start:515 stop:1072 length:558 start_codon:yes stop_codon:yes gene_type:complete